MSKKVPSSIQSIVDIDYSWLAEKLCISDGQDAVLLFNSLEHDSGCVPTPKQALSKIGLVSELVNHAL